MNKMILMAASFLMGGVAGFFVGRALTEKRCNDRADAEIESVKKAFANRRKKEAEEAENIMKDALQIAEKVGATKILDLKEALRKANEAGYSEKTELADDPKPRVISPEEFGSIPEYEEVSLTYFSDGTLTGDDERPMSEIEIEMSVGKDSLGHFGEYELDSVFVRNDHTKTDYEILKDERSYAELLEEKPYLND